MRGASFGITSYLVNESAVTDTRSQPAVVGGSDCAAPTQTLPLFAVGGLDLVTSHGKRMTQSLAVFGPFPASLPATWPRDAAAWRARWVDAGVGGYEDWNHLRVVALRERLWVLPGSPAAVSWLEANLDGVAGVVADAAGEAVPLDWRTRQVGVRSSDDMLWSYRLPSFVVEKRAGAWGHHFEDPLSPELRAALCRKVEAALRHELAVWGRLPAVIEQDPFLVVADPGRAAIVPAIGAARSGHGKPVSVLIRRGVQLLSYWRFEGEFLLGPLASLGHGRLLRAIAPDLLDGDTQDALLALPSSAKDLVE